MEVSFQKPINVDATVTQSVPTTAPAPVAPETQPVSVPVTTPVDFDDDNIGFRDIILPRINIVQGVGDLSTIFTPGEIVLNQTRVIHEPSRTKGTETIPGTSPLILTVLGFRPRQFTEKVEGNKLGMLLNDEEAIVRHNGTLDYKEWQASIKAAKENPGNPPAKRYFQPLGTAVLLVQQPACVEDPDHTEFGYEGPDGKWYAIALWSMKGTAYTNGAKVMFTARKIGHLRKGYTEQQWSLTTKLEKYSDNFAWIPVLKPAAKNTDDFKAFCAQIRGAGN